MYRLPLFVWDYEAEYEWEKKDNEKELAKSMSVVSNCVGGGILSSRLSSKSIFIWDLDGSQFRF